MVYDQKIEICRYKITYEIPTDKEGECGGGSNVDDDFLTQEPIMVRNYWLKKLILVYCNIILM